MATNRYPLGVSLLRQVIPITVPDSVTDLETKRPRADKGPVPVCLFKQCWSSRAATVSLTRCTLAEIRESCRAHS